MTDLRLSGIGMTSARTRDRLVQRLREQGISNPAVLDRIRNVPRHIFVDEALGSRAYEDTALPIGFGQTISQPYIVARMTEALLEGGTARQRARGRHRLRLPDGGAGAARRRGSTASSASSRCSRARASDCASSASATCASVTATARSAGKLMRLSTGSWSQPRRSTVPEALIKQLKVGGRLLVPIGPEGSRSWCASLAGSSGSSANPWAVLRSSHYSGARAEDGTRSCRSFV